MATLPVQVGEDKGRPQQMRSEHSTAQRVLWQGFSPCTLLRGVARVDAGSLWQLTQAVLEHG